MITTTAKVRRPSQDKGTAATAAQTSEREPLMLRKRIGSTEYLVNVRYNPTATETLEDIILRLIEREVRTSA